jgi:hypothetical protein
MTSPTLNVVYIFDCHPMCQISYSNLSRAVAFVRACVTTQAKSLYCLNRTPFRGILFIEDTCIGHAPI